MLRKVFLDSEIETGGTFRSMSDRFDVGDVMGFQLADGSITDGQVFAVDAAGTKIKCVSQIFVCCVRPRSGT